MGDNAPWRRCLRRRARFCAWLRDLRGLPPIACRHEGDAVPSQSVSGVAIVSVAAVCAGYIWLERHQVRRVAKSRMIERRQVGVLRWCEPAPVIGRPASAALERGIEHAIRAADFACAYHERLFVAGAARESPFQLRRARVDAAHRRFAQAAERVEDLGSAWLSSAQPDPTTDEQSKLAVTRMLQWLLEHPVAEAFPVGDEQPVAATVGVFENVLANLRQRRMPVSGEDPFRHRLDSSPRQDVTAGPGLVPPRHVSASSFVTRR